MAASIFSVIDGLTVSKEEVGEAELFAEQFLSSQFPTYDFRQGTALRDMTVRPNATLLAMVNKAIKYYFDESDIVNITNTTDSSIVDERLSNFFIKRKTGAKAIIKPRLYFSSPTATPITVAIPSSATFSVDNELQWTTSGLVSVNPVPANGVKDVNSFYFEYDGSEDLHYVDVDLESVSTSTDANIEEGDLLYFTIFSPYFLKGSILYLSSTAIDIETNEDMVNRSYTSISTRNLINTPSIIARITDQFNYVSEVLPVGLGDDLLYRDLIDVEVPRDLPTDPLIYKTYHRGGTVDVYVDTDTIIQSVQLACNDAGEILVEGPVFSIRQALTNPAGTDPDTLPLGVDFNYSGFDVSRYIGDVPQTPEQDIGLSARQTTKITIASAVAGETITLDIELFSGIGAVQDAISSKDQRVVCGDYLVRAFSPTFIDVSIQTRTGAQDTTAAEIALAKYISDIPAGGTLYNSSVISVVQGAGVTDFILPISVTATAKNRFCEYSTTDSLITDEVVTDVIDTLNLSRNQNFIPRIITIAEVLIA